MNLTQDEILNALSFLSNEGVLQQPIEYSNDKIYLVTDLRLYDLLNEYSYWYDVSRSTLKKLWNLRRPTSEEIRRLQRIEGNEKVTRSIIRSQAYRNRVHHTYYERTKQIKDLKKKISETEMNDLTVQINLKKQQEWIKKYHKITKPRTDNQRVIRQQIPRDYFQSEISFYNS